MKHIAAAFAIILLLIATSAPAQAIRAGNLLDHPDSWYTSDEGKQMITNVISWQTKEGGWAKGYKGDHVHKEGEALGEWEGVGTIDNKYTYTEIRFLARAYNLTKRQDALDSFNRGIDYLLASQYPNGGWPQRYPVPTNYGRNITFNDNAMTNVLRLLEDIHTGDKDFAFVDADRKAKIKTAWEKGVDCIVKSQVKSGGKLTAWAQQYDPQTLLPAMGRSYELPSISGSESADVVELLMSIDQPTPEVVQAVEAAHAWYDASKFTGKKIQMVREEGLPRPVMKIVEDPNAVPIWARFYELETNRPFFCNRDGVKHYSIEEIDKERSMGYAWYGEWGNKVLRDYPKWQAKHPATK
jgi:PelA/Pel-15E family pectate lyase